MRVRLGPCRFSLGAGHGQIEKEVNMTILSGEEVNERGTFHCQQCNEEVSVEIGQSIPKCTHCGHDIFNDGGAEDTIH